MCFPPTVFAVNHYSYPAIQHCVINEFEGMLANKLNKCY